MTPQAASSTIEVNQMSAKGITTLNETKEDPETVNRPAPPRARSPMRHPQHARTNSQSPRRPQTEDREEAARLRAELASAKSEISSLRVELSQQQYELEEVNLIINLQDELRACKEVIHQQKDRMEQLTQSTRSTQSTLAQQEQVQRPTGTTENNSRTASASTEESSAPGAQQKSMPGQEDSRDWKEAYQELHARHSNLQNNLAWSEFQLRGRICNDSLRYHRRLIYWKSKNQKLEHELAQIKADRSSEIQELQTKWKATASSVLQHTLKDLKNTQGEVRQLEKELARVKLERNQPEIQIQDSSSKFLVKAAQQSNFL